MSVIEEFSEIKERKTIGQEFIQWAERYWHLDKLVKIENPDTFAGEVCDYNYIRDIFIKRIDGIVQERLK